MDRGAKRDSSATKEYVIATGVGTLYGATNTLVGHPFDTVKTKMQAQAGGAVSFYRGASMRSTIAKLWSTEGIHGFYRGCLPPLWGSAVYRSAQFAVFDLLHSSMADTPALCQPVVGGMEARVPLAGVVGATARTVMESPIEYAKVRGQTGQSWRLRDVYRGAGLQWARTGPMMTFYFCMFDGCQRAGLTATPIGQFFSSGGCALLGFWIVWPFETLKNQTQAGMGGTVIEKVRAMPGGVLGLYRGIIPGSLSVFLRNGAAMIVMRLANRKITEWGLRD